MDCGVHIVGVDGEIDESDTAGVVSFVVHLSGQCCEGMESSRKRLRFRMSLRHMEDSDDHGAGIAKQKLCQRVASHIDGYSGPGACTLKFHAERDTWGLEHIVSRLAEQRQKKTATKRKLNNKGEATSITWKYGTGYGLNRKLKSKHKKK